MTSTKILFATGPLGDQRKPGGRVDLLSVRKFRKNWLDEETHEMNKYASNYRVGEVVTYIVWFYTYCPATQPLLPNSHQPKQNWADMK